MAWEVDRIDWLISRQVNIQQKDITISRRMGMNLCEISRCSGISRALERIGDHGVLLATNLKPLIDDPTKLDEEILSTGRKAIALVVDSVGTWSKKDMLAANECIERGEELVARSKEISDSADELTGKPAMAAELIAGSVKRIAEYSMRSPSTRRWTEGATPRSIRLIGLNGSTGSRGAPPSTASW